MLLLSFIQAPKLQRGPGMPVFWDREAGLPYMACSQACHAPY